MGLSPGYILRLSLSPAACIQGKRLFGIFECAGCPDKSHIAIVVYSAIFERDYLPKPREPWS